VEVDGRVQAAELVRPGVLRVTCDVADGTAIEVGPAPR
jgi:hypothetical protein